MKLKVTPEAINSALSAITDKGWLHLKITRVGKDEFLCQGVNKKGTVIAEMPVMTLTVDNALELHCVKMEVEMEMEE